MSALQLHLSQAVLQIPAHQLLRLTDAGGTRLRAVAGTLWVTLDNDLRDIVLQSGDSLLVDSAQPVLVTALGGSATVAVCGPARPAQAGWRHWLGRPAAALAAA